MEKNKQKRKRCPNYTSQEKNLLINLVSKYKNVVLNQKTDGASNEEKENGWKTICTEFNAQSPAGVFREVDSLHRFFQNHVQTARKLAAEERQEIYGTGGGPKKTVKKDDTHELLLDLINKKSIRGLHNRYDNDVIDDIEEERLGEPLSDAELIMDGANYGGIKIDAMVDDDILNDHVRTRLSNSPELSSSAQQTSSKNIPGDDNVQPWKKYKGADLKKKKSVELKTTSRQSDAKSSKADYDCSRRRPIVAALTTSHVAEKYNQLLEIRLAIAQGELARITAQSQFEAEEQVMKKQRLRMENDNLKKRFEFEEKERQFKLEMLKQSTLVARTNYLNE